jgi:ABC-type xylose transport system permease subunit
MSEVDDALLTSAGRSTPPGIGSRSRQTVVLILEKYATLLLLVLLMIGFTLATDRFLTTDNLKNLLVVQAVISCVTFAAIIPLIAGEFDLSPAT